jgi:hypothetical protein
MLYPVIGIAVTYFALAIPSMRECCQESTPPRTLAELKKALESVNQITLTYQRDRDPKEISVDNKEDVTKLLLACREMEEIRGVSHKVAPQSSLVLMKGKNKLCTLRFLDRKEIDIEESGLMIELKTPELSDFAAQLASKKEGRKVDLIYGMVPRK